MSIKNLKKLIRPLDLVLVAFFLIFSFVPMGLFWWQQRNIPEGAEIYAVIIIDGQVIDRFRLYDEAKLLYTYTSVHGLTGNQYNVVEINANQIRVQKDNSPDQIGVNRGWISRPGQTIVVLPHRFLIRIEAVDNSEADIIIPF